MNKTVVTVIAVVSAILLGVFVWLYGSEFGHMIWSAFRRMWFLLVPVAILAVVGAYFMKRGIKGPYREEAKFYTLSWASWGLGILIFIGGALAAEYMTYSKISESVEVVEESPDDLTFRDRAPHAVASAVSSDTMGTVLGDATGTVKAIPGAGETGEYTTSVKSRGLFQGYEATQTISPPLFGGSTNEHVRFCEYSDEAKLRFGGMAPQNNLSRAIAWKTSPSVLAYRSDAFVVCDQETPMLYAPLTKLEGVFSTHRVPAGVAIYNGKTGDLTIEESYDGPLPVYPSSVATAQRESTQATGGPIDWIFGRAGYEATGGEMYAEFGLASGDGDDSSYVTPLKNRGDSSSIIALSTTQSNVMKTGELNPIEVRNYPQGMSRQSIGAVKAEITGNVLGGYKAQGLEVFEIIPRENGEWVASIGKSKSILYRATISSDGSIELVEGENLDSEADSDTIGTVDKPLEEMSTEELSELGKQIIDEISQREG